MQETFTCKVKVLIDICSSGLKALCIRCRSAATLAQTLCRSLKFQSGSDLDHQGICTQKESFYVQSSVGLKLQQRALEF